MATIRDVAKKAGVSPSTVSRILTGVVPVSEDTRVKVLSALSELNYVVTTHQPPVAGLCVGIILPKNSAQNISGHPAFYSATTTFVAEMEKHQIENTLVLLDDHVQDIEAVFANRLGGYFILGTSEEQEDVLLPFLKSKKIPYIILNRWIDDGVTNFVNVDDTMAAFNATRYLLQLGHRHVAFIGGNRNFRNSKLRIQGYASALNEAGLSVNQACILQGEYTEDYGYKVADELLRLDPRPTFALCSSDMIAVGLQRRLRELGFKLPQDFAMVGWGDFMIASYVRPTLSTIKVPNAEMGTQAAQALLNLIKNPSVVGMQVLMDAPLIVRESSLVPGTKLIPPNP